VRQSPALNVLVDDFYAGAEWRDAMATVRARQKVLQTQRSAVSARWRSCAVRWAASEEAGQYRLHGELLLAHQNEVTQGRPRWRWRISLPESGQLSRSKSPLIRVLTL